MKARRALISAEVVSWGMSQVCARTNYRSTKSYHVKVRRHLVEYEQMRRGVDQQSQGQPNLMTRSE